MTKSKCPWDKPEMRRRVKRAIDNVGGPRGFAFMSRGMREAIIDQMVFGLFMTAAQHSKRGATFDEMVDTRNLAYAIAGQDDGECNAPAEVDRP